MISDIINNIMPYVADFGQGIYLLVFFVALLESFIYTAFFVPGSAIIVLISFFSVQNGIDLKMIFLSGFFGVLTGNIISYLIGLNYNNKNYTKVFKIIKLESLQKTKKVIENHAFKTLTIGRLIPVFKEVIFFLSGVNKMNFYKFLIYTLIGNFIWSFVFIGVPYIFSYSLSLAQLWINKFSYFVLLLFFILLFFSYLRYLLLSYGRDILLFILNIFSYIKGIISRNRLIKYLIIKYPNFFSFLSNRFKKNEITGLPLTILLGLFVYFFLTFVGLIEDILKSEIIVGLDVRMSAFFYAFRNNLFIHIFLWISSLGRELIIVGFFIIYSIYLYISNKKNEYIAFCISLFGSILTGYFLKIFFHHTRPEMPVYLEYGYSFPSLHAVISMSFYGYIFWILIKKTKKLKKKINYLFTFFALVFLICFSRLYLGVHYLSDVLGGLLIGALWLLLGIGLTEYLNIKYPRNIVFNGNKYRFHHHYLAIFTIIFFIAYNSSYPYKILTNNTNKQIEIDIKNIDKIFTNNSMKYSQTFMGDNAENINFIFLAKNDSDIIKIFKNADFEDADKLNYNSIKNMLENLIFQKSYEKAPITPLFWDNTTQNFSFQKNDNNRNIRYRHHIRIWKTDYSYNGYFVYVGVGVYDDGLKWWYLSHKIAPDINKEREYIFSDLEKTGLIDNYNKLKITGEYKGKNIFGDKFFSDGEAYLVGVR